MHMLYLVSRVLKFMTAWAVCSLSNSEVGHWANSVQVFTSSISYQQIYYCHGARTVSHAQLVFRVYKHKTNDINQYCCTGSLPSQLAQVQFESLSGNRKTGQTDYSSFLYNYLLNSWHICLPQSKLNFRSIFHRGSCCLEEIDVPI